MRARLVQSAEGQFLRALAGGPDMQQVVTTDQQALQRGQALRVPTRERDATPVRSRQAFPHRQLAFAQRGLHDAIGCLEHAVFRARATAWARRLVRVAQGTVPVAGLYPAHPTRGVATRRCFQQGAGPHALVRRRHRQWRVRGRAERARGRRQFM